MSGRAPGRPVGPGSAPAPVSVRPRVLTWVCVGVAVLLLVSFALVAVALGAGDSPDRFRLTDQLSMFGLGVVLAAVTLIFTRARVDADIRGIRVRNPFGTKQLPWQVVVGVRLDEGASWATLDLQDDETVALMALQSGDGDRAVEAVLALRALLAFSRDGSAGGSGSSPDG